MLSRLLIHTNKVINNTIHHYYYHLKQCSTIIFQQPQLSLCGLQEQQINTPGSSSNNSIFDSIVLFAAPKKRMSRSKKRMKTTLRDRIPLKANIIRDGRTGEMTLMHKLPFRWMEHIPDLMVGYQKPTTVTTATSTDASIITDNTTK